MNKNVYENLFIQQTKVFSYLKLEEFGFYIKKILGKDLHFTLSNLFFLLSEETGLSIVCFANENVTVFDQKNNMGFIFFKLSYPNFELSRVTLYDQSDKIYSTLQLRNPVYHILDCEPSCLEFGFLFQSRLSLKPEKIKIEDKQLKNFFFDILADTYFKLRHEFIVLCIFNLLNMPFQKERRFSEVFPELLTENKDKTPDIMIKLENSVHIIEVSVSAVPNLSELEKHKKYDSIIKEISDFCEVRFDVIAVTSNYGNLYAQLFKIFPHLQLHNQIDKTRRMGDDISNLIRHCAPYFAKKIDPNLERLDEGKMRDIEETFFEMPEYNKVIENKLLESMSQPAYYSQILDNLIDTEPITDKPIDPIFKKTKTFTL